MLEIQLFSVELSGIMPDGRRAGRAALAVLLLVCLSVAGAAPATAQGNPYAMIGPVPMVEYAMPFERMPRLANADTTSDTAAMLIDGYGGKIHFVDASDSILGTAELPEDAVLMWLSVDPMLDKYPSISPYAYCLWNPVRFVDPDGEDWYEVCNKETGEKEIKWTEWHSQKDLDKNNVDGLYLGTRVVVFAGSLNERLDKDGKLEGDDGIYANITVYGSQENDIGIYRGFTMSSNYELYGAIEDGYYDVVYDERGKTGALPSNYAVEGRNPVGCLNGRNNAWYNKVSGAYSSTQKNGIFVHRTNRSGFAGGNVSTGCPLVRATDWDAFSKQIGNNGFKLILRRTE